MKAIKKSNGSRKTARGKSRSKAVARASASKTKRKSTKTNPSGPGRPELRPGFYNLPKDKGLDELRDIARRFKSRTLTPSEVEMLAENRQRRPFTSSELVLLYHEEGLSFFDCGYILGVGGSTLSRYMKRWGIPSRRSGLGMFDLVETRG